MEHKSTQKSFQQSSITAINKNLLSFSTNVTIKSQQRTKHRPVPLNEALWTLDSCGPDAWPKCIPRLPQDLGSRPLSADLISLRRQENKAVLRRIAKPVDQRVARGIASGTPEKRAVDSRPAVVLDEPPGSVCMPSFVSALSEHQNAKHAWPRTIWHGQGQA